MKINPPQNAKLNFPEVMIATDVLVSGVASHMLMK